MLHGCRGRPAHLGEPGADIVPSDANDVAAFERAALVVGVVSEAVLEQVSVAKAQVVDETCIDTLRNLREIDDWLRLVSGVPSDKSFVAFTDDPRLTPPSGK